MVMFRTKNGSLAATLIEDQNSPTHAANILNNFAFGQWNLAHNAAQEILETRAE